MSMSHKNALGTIIGVSPEVRSDSSIIDLSDMRRFIVMCRSQNGRLTFAKWLILAS